MVLFAKFQKSQCPMIKINRLSDYAVVMLATLAADPDNALTTNTIADSTALPLTIVRKLMQQLREAGLVQATLGQQGGYQLSRSALDISLAQILGAIQGDIALTQCTNADHGCQVQCQYHFAKHWQHINRSIQDLLSNISLNDMMQKKSLNLSIEKSLKKEGSHG
jgi:FeS assembly SUF system regulator